MNVASCAACGGSVGANSGSVATSYSIGAVSAAGGAEGGLIGSDTSARGSLSDTYWDFDTSDITDLADGAGNVANDPGIVGLSDAQLKSGLPKGFAPKIWKESAGVNGGYPYLRSNTP